MIASITIWLAASLLAVLLLILETFKPVDQKWTWFTRSRYNLPKGPPGQPIVGNMLQFLNARKSGRLASWLRSLEPYGEMATLRLGSETWILLNSKEAADYFINKNGRITHERPPMPIASGLVSQGKRTVCRQTKEWLEGRRVMHLLLSGKELRTYGAWQELVSLRLLLSYVEKPEQWFMHHFKYAMAVLYRIVMGDELDKTQEELDVFQFVGMEFVQSIGLSMIDFFPSLDKLPKFLQPWRPYWRKMGERHRALMVDWWNPTYTRVRNGTAKSSFVRDTLLHPRTKYKGSVEEAMYLAISIITAGSENMRMGLHTFVMSMISNPECFAKARAEVDALCSHGKDLRLPGLQDLEQLPYVTAIIKELIRWRPTNLIIPPHQLTEDLHYKDYIFPKGVCFVVNSVAVSQEFPDADAFKPERWMDGHQDNIVHNHWEFGGGRRICPGYRVAQQALFIALTRLIFCFDMYPNGEFDNKVLNHVSLEEPFPVRINIRSSLHEDLIRKELAEAIEAEK